MPSAYSKKKSFHILAGLLIIGTLFISYSNTFYNQFVFDDFGNISDNPSLRLPSLTYKNLANAVNNSPTRYRWLPKLSFAFNTYLFGDETFSFHVVNLVIHILCTLTFYILSLLILRLPFFGDRYKQAREAALVAALLWGLHPLQTNAVTYIVQRMTSMASLFYMLSIFFYIKARLPKKITLPTGFLFLACAFSGLMAIASKENSAILPLSILAVEYYFLGGSFTLKTKGQIILIGGAVLAVLTASVFFLEGTPLDTLSAGYEVRDFSLGQRLLTEPRIIFLYLSLLLLPLLSRLNLNHDIQLSTGLLNPPQTCLAILGIIGLLWLCFFLFNRSRLTSFAILWFLLNLVIESSFIALELVYEHRMYLPATFLILSFTAEGYRWCSSRIVFFRVLAILLASGFIFLTWQRNFVWESELTLWSDVVRKSPQLVRGYGRLGTEYLRQQKYQTAEKYFQRAVELAPGDGRGYKNLGIVYAKLNRIEEAIYYLEKAASLVQAASLKNKSNKKQLKGDQILIHNNLGLLYLRFNNFNQALGEADQVLKVDHNNTDALLTKGIALEELDREEEAFQQYRQAWRTGYDMVSLHNRWAEEYLDRGERKKALAHLERVLMLDPGNAAAQTNHAKALLLAPGTH